MKAKICKILFHSINILRISAKRLGQTDMDEGRHCQEEDGPGVHCGPHTRASQTVHQLPLGLLPPLCSVRVFLLQTAE